MTFAPSGARQNPILDENSFQQVLAAAYILQEHNDALRARNARHDPARIASEIASTRSQILADGQDFASAAVLIADCLRSLTSADGASICLVNDGYLSCAACSGTAARVPGGSIASNSLVATELLRNGHTFQSSNARSDIRLEPALSLAAEIGSLVTVPIQRNNEVAGLVELRWNKADVSEEWDKHVCELAVGLINEALDRETGVVNAAMSSLPTEQGAPAANSSAESLTPITPKLEELLPDFSFPSSSFPVSQLDFGTGAVNCRVCGHAVPTKDEFCGNCGMLTAPSDDGLQSKWASMWFMQQARKAVEPARAQRERLWPIDEVNAEKTPAVASLELGRSNLTDEEIQKLRADAAGADETEEALSDDKSGPRSVLAILKAQFKVRASGR